MSAATKKKEKKSATEAIDESIRDLLSLKLTLPLGDKNLKNVHTNQFIWTTLPDEFRLENMAAIANAMNSSFSRHSGYTTDRWYIEGVTITNDGSSAKMELELNPFASAITKYRDDFKSFKKAYADAFTKTTSTTSNSTKKTVKSTSNKNTTLKGGAGKYLDNIVAKAVGKQTNDLKKAKLIDKAFKSHVYYKYYWNTRFSSNERAYKNAHLNCADGANVLCAMFRSGGLNAKIVHVTGHYIVRVTIKGKKYFTDNAAATGSHTSRPFGKTWKGMTRGSVVGTHIS